MSRDALSFEDVWKSYPQVDGRELHALRSVTARVESGLRVAIVGRSGSGKSTLLHLAAGIDEPSRGEVSVLGRRLSELGDHERTLQRREKIGLVFQFFHLLPHLGVLDNVVLPSLIAGDQRRDYEPRGRELRS
jgi:ABC-type lipoprotein export system ATPase subunit